MKHLTWKTYQALIQEARHLAHINATAQFSTVRSTGVMVTAFNAEGVKITEDHEGDASSLTLNTFLSECNDLMLSNAASIRLSGSFDGAESLYELNRNNYHKSVSTWSFVVWNSTDGWIQTPVRETEFGEVPFEYLENM